MSSPLPKALGLTWLFRNDRKDYQSLHPEEKSDMDSDKASTHVDDDPNERIPPRKLSILLRLSVVTLALALIVVSTLYVQLRNRATLPPRVDCGTTLEEAREKGCAFDQLMKTWLPSECPRFGLEEHVAAGFAAGNDTGSQWRYYLDRQKTQEISIDELSESTYFQKASAPVFALLQE
jgi:hypothetical protein